VPPRGPVAAAPTTSPPAARVRISVNPSPPSVRGQSPADQPGCSRATASAAIAQARCAEIES